MEAKNPVPPDATHVSGCTPVDIADLHIGKPVLRVVIESEEDLPAFPHAVLPVRLRPLKITLPSRTHEKEPVLLSCT
jgi:hypothetical protein